MKREINKLKKVILFYNPNSGDGLFKNNLDLIIERYQNAGFLVIPVRAAHGHVICDYLSELDQSTYRQEYWQIIAAGGDGTLNVCVNAMIRSGIDLPIAILPAGTANDFAYYFDIPDDIDKMLDIAMGENYTFADVGRLNDRYFINVAAIGQVVNVSQKTDTTLKNTIGIMAYYLKGLSAVPNMKATKVTLTTPEKVYHEKMYFMVVMNGESAGGFKRISPGSEINDGMLDVLLFRKMSMLEMPGLFVKILNGSHLDSKKVLHFKTSRLTVEAEEELPTDIDGELGENFPLQFSVLHNRLKICTAKENMGGK